MFVQFSDVTPNNRLCCIRSVFPENVITTQSLLVYLRLDGSGWESAGCRETEIGAEAGGDGERGPYWDLVHKRKGTEGKCQTNVKRTGSAAGSEMPLFPTFIFLPPGFPHTSRRCCRPHFVHFVCSFPFVPACSASLSLISDCPCQLFCWCFLLYFHLTPSCRAYQTLLTASAVRNPLCLLVRDVLPLTHWTQANALFDQDPLVLSVWLKGVWPGSNRLLGLFGSVFSADGLSADGRRPKSDWQKPVTISQMSRMHAALHMPPVYGHVSLKISTGRHTFF